MEPTNTPTPTPAPAPAPAPEPVITIPEPAASEPVITIPEPVAPAPAPLSATEPVVSAAPAPAPAPEPAPIPTLEPISSLEAVAAEPTPSIGTTEPIMMPTTPKAPDPLEEELKAPIKAAEPVPGSIGSAISVPSANGANPTAKTPSVAFNDPAMKNQMAVAKPAAKKQTSKTTWILLGVLAVAIIGVLVFVLVKMLSH